MSTRCQDDRIWIAIREEVKRQVDLEPILASFLHATILNHDCLEDASVFTWRANWIRTAYPPCPFGN